MPSYALYQKMLGSVSTGGELRKQQSDNIIDATWWDDISSRVGYLYDWYHDDHQTQLNDLHPDRDSKKIPIDIKFLQYSSQTYSKDPVTFHLQLRPGQKCNVSYYNEMFGRYSATWPVGLYIDIQDEQGMFNRWLIVGKANYNTTAFPTFELLRCDYILRCVIGNNRYHIPVVLRSQNSYNSGVWTDNVVTVTEDQQKFCTPLNIVTEQIYYQQRFIFDNAIYTEPRTWYVTKIDRISSNGIGIYTTAQTTFDETIDRCEILNSDMESEFKRLNELSSTDNIVGWWADYALDSAEPQEANTPEYKTNITCKITNSGKDPDLRVNGGYRKFTVTFYENDEEITMENGTWTYTIDGTDVSSLLQVLTSSTSSDLDNNQIKVKFTGGTDYIGSVLNITYTSSASNATDTITSKIIGL